MGGWEDSAYHPPPPTGAGAPAPTQSGGRYCVVEPTVSAAGRGLPFRGVGGAAFHFQFSLLPPHPKSASDVSRPERGGAGSGGGGVGSGLCPDTCLPRRPGLAGVWREGGSLAPRPVQPPRIKGRLRRGETSGRPGGGRGAWVRSRGGAESRVLADPQETSAADLVWDTGSGCWGEGETSRLSWLPGQVAGVLELTPTRMPWRPLAAAENGNESARLFPLPPTYIWR